MLTCDFDAHKQRFDCTQATVHPHRPSQRSTLDLSTSTTQHLKHKYWIGTTSLTMANAHRPPTLSEIDDQGNEIPTPLATATNGDPQTPEARPAGITIVFKDAAGNEVSFKLKSTTKLKKAMDAYAARVERERHTLRFLFEGERVQNDSTTESVSPFHFPSSPVHQTPWY